MGKKIETNSNKLMIIKIQSNLPIQIRNHFQKAQRIFSAAQVLAEQDDWEGVFSRLYYAILHIIVGSLRGIDADLSKHKHIFILQAFREKFIANGIFPKGIYTQILDFKNLRERADYQIDDFNDIDESKDLIEEASKIINLIIDYWNKKNPIE